MLGLANRNDSHCEGGKRWESGREMRDDILVPLFEGPYNSEPVCVCVCVRALGGPLCVPAGACLLLKACAALPGGAPAVCCVILSGACLGRPFPHSARCAVKHAGVGGMGVRGKKARPVNITWT